MQPHANRAGDWLIGLALTFVRIVGDPALHVQARIWAAANEWRHFAAIQNVSLDDQRPRLRGNRCGQGRRLSSTFGPQTHGGKPRQSRIRRFDADQYSLEVVMYH